MVELRMAPDCGNAPKSELLRDYAVVLADRDVIRRLLGTFEMVARRAVLSGPPPETGTADGSAVGCIN
jgi:hypothetical protein